MKDIGDVLFCMFCLGVLVWTAWMASTIIQRAQARDNFVQLIEQSVGMTPGTVRVLPACQCTIRYSGTSVNGNHYAVHIDRLD